MRDYILFLDSFFEQISKAGIDVSGYKLDHFAYQASSAEDYETVKPKFLELGEEASEEMIGGRRVSVFKLHSPIAYKEHSIGAVELIEPREGQVCDSMWQHAEFIMPEAFEKYMEKYPDIDWDTTSLSRPDFAHLKLNFENGLTLKFLHEPILQMVKKHG
jgi:predicted metalloenzyme YecM